MDSLPFASPEDHFQSGCVLDHVLSVEKGHGTQLPGIVGEL
jgi:hypothetical protein